MVLWLHSLRAKHTFIICTLLEWLLTILLFTFWSRSATYTILLWFNVLFLYILWLIASCWKYDRCHSGAKTSNSSLYWGHFKGIIYIFKKKWWSKFQAVNIFHEVDLMVLKAEITASLCRTMIEKELSCLKVRPVWKKLYSLSCKPHFNNLKPEEYLH